MANIALKNISTDPFKDETFTINELTDNNLVDMGDVYHKTTKIKFNKSEEQSAEELISTEIRTYVNSKILTPIPSQEVGLPTPSTPSTTPTYSFTTNRFAEPNIDFTLKPEKVRNLEELEIYTFYNNDDDSLNQRNIVFNSNTPMAGSPDSDITKYEFSNILFMTYPATGEISNHIQSADRLGYEFSLYERFMVLFGHYSGSILAITNEEDLTLKTILDNYNYPFPVDAYYTISNKPIDLSYDVVQQQVFNQIRKTVSKNSMNYSEILDGDKNPNEYLFFRIEKWFSDIPVGTPDQVFFMSATEQNKLFVDIQIRENQTYYYRATAYYAVIGQEYFFSDIVDNGDSGECVVNVRPKIDLGSTIVFENTLKNIPAPPLPPFVSFHNKASENDKIKIYLELQRGQLIAEPISVTGQMNEVGSNYILPDNKIEFRHSKQGAKFQVFRLTEEPTSYEQFSESLIGSFENNNMTENMVVLDNILPNKKYYYTFRSFNEFGSFSNPTAVYEVELIKDADDSRVLVNSILITENQDDLQKTSSLNFRSLLGINVADQQVAFNTENLQDASGDIPTFKNKINIISLGNAGDSGELLEKIWGEKFKFRVRSNDSGKIIDFNVKVNLIKE